NRLDAFNCRARIVETGIIDKAERLEVWHDLFDDVELQLGRHQIGNSGGISAWVLFLRHQFGLKWVGDGREDDRNVFSGGDGGLAGRCRNSDDDIRVLANELAHDLLRGAEIALRALEVDDEILAFGVAMSGK